MFSSLILFDVLTSEVCFKLQIESLSLAWHWQGGLSCIGLSSHRQICPNLLLNNSVDLFHCWTTPQRVRERGKQPFLQTYILFYLQLTYFLSSVTFFMQKSQSLSFLNLQVFPSTLLSHQLPLLQRRSDFWQVCRRNSLLLNPFIFIHTNTGLEPLEAPQIQSQSGLLTDSFLLFIQTLTKFTSTPLIDLNHQHSTRGRYQGAWQWICRMNIVEDDLITLQLTFTIIILVSQNKAQSRVNLAWNIALWQKYYIFYHIVKGPIMQCSSYALFFFLSLAIKWRYQWHQYNYTCVWNVFLLFSHSLIHLLLRTLLIYHISLSCQSLSECIHTVRLSLFSRSSVCACRFSPQLWLGSHWWASWGPKHLGTGRGLLPPFHPLAPPFLVPATWSSCIYHSQLKWQKAAGKCRGGRTIIYVA